MRRIHTFHALCVGALFGLSGCVSVHHDHDRGRYERAPAYERSHGPPPHAPAHGYRQHRHGVDHVFDGRLGVYTVVGQPHTYWHDGGYWRHSQGYWERGARPRGGHWSRADWKHVPKQLRPRYAEQRDDADRDRKHRSRGHYAPKTHRE
jgi:hypothetical protein